ncbi:MAG: hypothetical protein WC604_05160 [Candidatus Gracilibacteria bacterium]
MKKIVVAVCSCFSCAAFLMTGCGGGGSPIPGLPGVPGESSANDSASDNAAEELGEQMAEEMMGGVDIEFAEEGSGEVVPWPEKMPSDVPVFGYGRIDATQVSPAGEEGISVVVSFIDVEDGAYDKYKQDLESAGWTIIDDLVWGDVGFEYITAEKGEGRTVDMDVDPMGEGTAFLYYMEY